MKPGSRSQPTVAYLVSQYPKLSHSFITSEIHGLRRAGMSVATFSVNSPSDVDLQTVLNRSEKDSTTFLIQKIRSNPIQIALSLLRKPRVATLGLLEAWRFSARAANRRWPFYFLEAWVLVQELHQRRIRHVHVHLANNAADVAHIAITMGRLIDGRRWSWSLAVHGPNELNDITAFNLKRKVESAGFVCCITEYCRSQIMALTPPSRWGNVHVIRMGIDPELFDDPTSSRSSVGPIQILYVGRLVAEKAPELLVQAMARLERGTFDLRMAGSGELFDPLANMIVELGLTGEVHLLGALTQDQLPSEYRRANIFCLPSFSEGLPVVLMEAMASRTTVVSSRIAGIPELVVDGVNGILVSPGNIEELVSALSSLKDPAVRHRLGARGRDMVLDRHVATDIAIQLATLLTSHMDPS